MEYVSISLLAVILQ